MTPVLWVFAGLIVYVVGLLIIAKMTPKLLMHTFDDGWFMGIAALNILGALLTFGAIILLLLMFNGALAVRVLDFFLLVGVLISTTRLASASFRPYKRGTVRASRILAGCYCVFLFALAIYCLVLIFTVA